VVLPFANTSDDSDNQYFCDGLTDELINRLARTPNLRVVARTSSFQFKDMARDVREIGRLLDASRVLEGSVRRSGDRIRVTVQLINVADGCHVWSERYDAEIADIFEIHERISTAIQRALQASALLAGADPPAPTDARSFEAYNLYLLGRFHWKKRTEKGLRTALDSFAAAVDLDPGFARAYSGLADCHLMLGMSATEAPSTCMPRAAAAATRALELDPGLAEAHTSLGAVKNCYEWDREGAEREYRRALALDPAYATTFHWAGLFSCAASARLDEAVANLEEAVVLDPLSPPIVADLGITHALREDSEKAMLHCRRALELDPHFHRPHWFLGLNFAWAGSFPAAEEALLKGLELCPGRAFRSRLLGALGFVHGQRDQRDRVEAIWGELDRLAQGGYVSAFDLAQVELGRGNREAALTLLERTVEERDGFAIFLEPWLTFRALGDEPRFANTVQRIGMAS
jgi:TolB-like protein/Flp pilus assembly protein TadD